MTCERSTRFDGVDVEVITSPSEWEALQPEWRSLFDASPSAAFPLRWEWLREWWRTYADTYAAPQGLRILTARRDRRLVGALPLYLAQAGRRFGVRRLRFLSTGEREFEETCPDYLDLLHAPGEGDRCASAFCGYLSASDGGAWDELDLTAMRADSPLLAQVTPELGGAPLVTSLGTCPIADLSGGFDAYYERLSNSRRALSRRLFRVAERADARFAIAADESTAARFFDELVALHQARWTAADKPGCFAAPRFTAFLRALVVAGVAGGSAVLARLAVRDRPLAVVCGFRTRSKFDFYQSGIDRTTPAAIESPGLTVQFFLMRALADQGVTTYDFLRGTTEYKQRLATTSAPLCAVRVTRPNVRTAMHDAVRQVRRAARAGLSMLTPPPAGEAAHP